MKREACSLRQWHKLHSACVIPDNKKKFSTNSLLLLKPVFCPSSIQQRSTHLADRCSSHCLSLTLSSSGKHESRANSLSNLPPTSAQPDHPHSETPCSSRGRQRRRSEAERERDVRMVSRLAVLAEYSLQPCHSITFYCEHRLKLCSIHKDLQKLKREK
ncbi:hypothetical protein NL108_007218 [Boleophthalmus pectinirostris]|nr:hypothetical protein NL108_007218 [Boleophthalmus pectinirostris]